MPASEKEYLVLKRVLKNKNQAVRQGARRCDKRSIFNICEHWREPCNAEWRPHAQFFNNLLKPNTSSGTDLRDPEEAFG